jgi:hypothetical protein
MQKDNYQDIETFRAFWQGLADEVATNVVDNREEYGLRSEEMRKKQETKHLFPCSLIFHTIYVMSDGKVALCCMDFDAKTELGDLNKQSIREVYGNKKWTHIKQLHIEGRGNEIGLCSKIRCLHLFSNASAWWLNKD